MTTDHPMTTPPLTDDEVEAFVTDGVVRLDGAFPVDLAAAGREILWADLGADPDDPRTWTRPVIRLGQYAQEPFRRAANTPRLDGALDQLVGPGRWQPRGSRVRLGSHLDVVPLLAPAGRAGREFFELAAEAEDASAHREVALATGRAGDVWLCHPFVVHAAQPHRGTRPRFMAQPPVLPSGPLHPDGPSPVERAIRLGLG